MQPRYYFCLLAVAATMLAPTARPDPVEARAKIVKVTIYPDRSLVEREAAVELPAGRGEYILAGLPGWIDEESVRVALSPAGAGRIVDVQVRRDRLAKTEDADVRAAEAAVQQVDDQLAALEDELKILAAQGQQIEQVRAFSTEQLPKDTLTKGPDVEGYDAVVQYVAKTLRGLADARRKIERERRELVPELQARQRRLAELGRRGELEQTTITVAVESPKAGSGVLSLASLLPGATWEAAHELRAAGERPGSVEIASYAIVSQTTGEDWHGAQLFFSTQSPVETMERPELDALIVGGQAMTGAVAGRAASSFSKAKAVYEGQNAAWFAYNNGDVLIDDFTSNLVRQQDTQARVVEVFRRLQKRGTTGHFEGRERPTVRSDGRQVRVPIGAMTLRAEERIIAVPERNPNAVRTVELVNTSPRPVLPGRVALFQGEAFLGHTDVGFVAENEAFSLLLGLADRVKVSRVLDTRSSSLVRGERTRMDIAFNITLENLLAEPVEVRLSDRVPVSQNRDIRVSHIDIDPTGRPDDQGLLHWTVPLKPGEKKAYRVAYTLEYPSALLQQVRRAVRAAGSEMDMQQTVAPAEQVLDDIQQLESLF